MRRAALSARVLPWFSAMAVVGGAGCASHPAGGGWTSAQAVESRLVAREPVVTPSGPIAPVSSPLTSGFADGDASALSDFRDVLAPYGAWHSDPKLGVVWVPDRAIVGENFAPYLTSGRWGLNESQAHVWLSDHDETFGWVVFHYGRWLWANERGWVWVPGRTYAPAWVVWRAGSPGEPFVGWGPAPPSFLWKRGRPVPFEAPSAPLVFCPAAQLFHEDIEHRVVPLEQAAVIAPSLGEFDARTSDVTSRPRFAPSMPAVAARGPSVESGHVPAFAWPAERHSRAGTPNARYASPGGMGRRPSTGPYASHPAPGADLKTFVTGGVQMRASTPPRSAYLHVPVVGGWGGAAEPRQGPIEDTAVGPPDPH